MLLKQSKISGFRLWGLLLTLIGMGLMIFGMSGIVFDILGGKVFAAVFLVIGMLCMIGSMAIYFWAGMLSTSAVTIECPECDKPTKMLGKTDRCMFCRTILTFDPKYSEEADAVEDTNADGTLKQ